MVDFGNSTHEQLMRSMQDANSPEDWQRHEELQDELLRAEAIELEAEERALQVIDECIKAVEKQLPTRADAALKALMLKRRQSPAKETVTTVRRWVVSAAENLGLPGSDEIFRGDLLEVLSATDDEDIAATTLWHAQKLFQQTSDAIDDRLVAAGLLVDPEVLYVQGIEGRDSIQSYGSFMSEKDFIDVAPAVSVWVAAVAERERISAEGHAAFSDMWKIMERSEVEQAWNDSESPFSG